MKTLFVLQFMCCVGTAVAAFMLALSRFQMRWRNRRYEQSRWILFVVMLIFAAYYLVSMRFRFDDYGADVAALTAMLVYTPASFSIAYAIINLVADRMVRRRVTVVSVVTHAHILAFFLWGWLGTGSLHIGAKIYAMLAMFECNMIYLTWLTGREIRRAHRQLEWQLGEDLSHYVRYVQASLGLLGATAVAIPMAIFFRSTLIVVAPLLLVSLIAFVHAFMALGFYYEPTAVIANAEGKDADKPHEENESGRAPLSDERAAAIDEALEKWCADGGFRNTEANMALMAIQLGINKEELTRYFARSRNSNFRIWLSDIRFREAQRMLTANPNYSNDAISFACGFSSHSQLYKVFRAKTGMTPGQWRDSITA